MALIHEKMIAVMKDVGPIAKAQYNKAQNFKFRGIDDIYNTFHKLFERHEVFLIPVEVENTHLESIQGKDKYGNDRITFRSAYTMQYKFMAADGSFETIKIPGEGVDFQDKATGKALSNALKYAILQMFMIATDDQKDSDQDSLNTEDLNSLKERAKAAIEKNNWPEAKKKAIKNGLPNFKKDMLEKIIRGEA